MTPPVRWSPSGSPTSTDFSPMAGKATAAEEHTATTQLAAAVVQVLFTPAQAAAQLQVRESWLRRRAARRAVPCTFLGKHLRFSQDDIKQIAAAAAQPPNAAIEGSRTRRSAAHTRPARNEHI